MNVPFGPWREELDPVERIAQFRALAALAAVFAGSGNPLVAAFRAAERDDDAAVRALELLDRLPTLPRRRLLATFGAITWPQRKRARP